MRESREQSEDTIGIPTALRLVPPHCGGFPRSDPLSWRQGVAGVTQEASPRGTALMISVPDGEVNRVGGPPPEFLWELPSKLPTSPGTVGVRADGHIFRQHPFSPLRTMVLERHGTVVGLWACTHPVPPLTPGDSIGASDFPLSTPGFLRPPGTTT